MQNDWVPLTITPDWNYELDTVTVTGESGDAVGFNYFDNGFWMPGENVTVNATFRQAVTYTVTIADGIQHGSVGFAEGYTSPAAAGIWFYLDIQPDEGYALQSVTAIGESGEPCAFDESNYSFLMPEENVTITYTVTAQKFTFTEDGSFDLGMTVGDTTGKPAGEYSDTLTFTANVQSVSAGE